MVVLAAAVVAGAAVDGAALIGAVVFSVCVSALVLLGVVVSFAEVVCGCAGVVCEVVVIVVSLGSGLVCAVFAVQDVRTPTDIIAARAAARVFMLVVFIVFSFRDNYNSSGIP